MKRISCLVLALATWFSTGSVAQAENIINGRVPGSGLGGFAYDLARLNMQHAQRNARTLQSLNALQPQPLTPAQLLQMQRLHALQVQQMMNQMNQQTLQLWRQMQPQRLRP